MPKISQLESATDVTANDLIQVVDVEDDGMAPSGTNKKATAQLLANELGKLTNITATGSTTARSLANRFADVVSVEDFGAVGGPPGSMPSVDDTAAIQAWVNYLRTNNAKGRIPGRAYKVTSLDMFPIGSYTIEGDSLGDSQIWVDNANRDQVGLKFTNPTNPLTRGKAYMLSRFQVRAGSNTKACLIEHRNASNAKWEDIEVLHYQGASCVRLTGLFNCDFNRVQVWGGGHNIPFKDTGTLTFSITSGSTTLTSSSGHFSAGDVGRKITLGQSGVIASTFTIASFTSTTQVEVVESAVATYLNVRATWGGLRGSMTSGSPTLTLELDRLTASDIGRAIYIIGAGKTDSSAVFPLRATIINVSGSTITLDSDAITSVTNAELVFDPAVDIGQIGTDDATNDARFSNLMIEQHRGCGLVASGGRLDFRDLKLHSTGYNVGGQNSSATNIQGLFYFYSGLVDGVFESTLASNVGRIVITAQNSQSAMFGNFITIGINNMPVFYGLKNRSSGAVTTVGSFIFVNPGLNRSIITNAFGGDGTALWHQKGAITGYNFSEWVVDYSSARKTFASNAAAIAGGLPVGSVYIRTGHGLDVVV